MPRRQRVVIPHCPHHVTQRGNNRRDVFYSDDDRKLYLALLKEQYHRYQVDVLGYCLMSNHVHALVTPTTENGLAKAFGRAQNEYARCVHIRRGESGHLWQARFYSCPVEAPSLWAVLAYIERNPVRAGLVQRCEEWPWSSAPTHLGRPAAIHWLELRQWRENWGPAQWQVALESGLAEADLHARLLEATCSGLPLGDSTFVALCEQKSGLKLGRQKPGPKAKLTDDENLHENSPPQPTPRTLTQAAS